MRRAAFWLGGAPADRGVMPTTHHNNPTPIPEPDLARPPQPAEPPPPDVVRTPIPEEEPKREIPIGVPDPGPHVPPPEPPREIPPDNPQELPPSREI